MARNHDVYEDYGGWRLTCNDCQGSGRTCRRQPYMTTKQWKAALREFKKKHPFDKARQWR